MNFHVFQQNLLPYFDFVKTGQNESVNHNEVKSLHLQDIEYDQLRIPATLRYSCVIEILIDWL